MSTLGFEIRQQAGVARQLAQQLGEQSTALATAASALGWSGASGDACQAVLGSLGREINSCAGHATSAANVIDVHARAVEVAEATLPALSPPLAAAQAAQSVWNAVTR